MKTILILLLFPTIICLIFGCSNDTEQTKTDTFTHTLALSSVLTIPIDANTSSTHPLVRYNANQNYQTIYFIDRDILHFYDIDSHKKIDEIKLPAEGPDGTQGGEQALYINDDSIFVKGHNPIFIHHINRTGKKLNTYNLAKNFNHRAFFTNSNSAIEYYNRNLYFYLNAEVGGNKILLDTPVIFSLSTVDGRVSSLPFKFPKPFADDSKQWVFIHYNPGMTVSKDRLLLSYPLLDSIYDYSISQKTITQRSLLSIFQSRANEVITKSSSMNVEKAFYGQYQTTTAYNYLVKDDFRDVYYRFVLHSKDYEAKNNIIPLETILNDKPISIQIINRNLECIGEIKLPSKQFVINDFFVGKDGLYISNNHPENQKTNENTLSYSRFVLSKL